MKARVIAFYLPQFHPVPENDKYWGKGFTEWTNVAKAKPLFRGHYQPRIPADLGFYDLRLPEVREEQAQLAREAGVEGFCYWHYWFGNGRQVLERPFDEVVASGKPDFPFCLAWANHDWTTGSWEKGIKDQIIFKQEFPGEADHIAHFNKLLPAFKDHRYITVDGKPIFFIWDPYRFKDIEGFMQLWNRLAKENDLEGIYFVAIGNSTTTIKRRSDGTVEPGRIQPDLKSSAKVYKDFLALGFNAVCSIGKSRAEMIYMGKYKRALRFLLQERLPFLLPSFKYDYPKVMKYSFAPEDSWENVFPAIMPQWDRSPRSGNKEGIYINATPEHFKHHIEDALKVIANKQPEHKILILRSWNEWGEGNYVEPDLKYGHGFLNALKSCINE